MNGWCGAAQVRILNAQGFGVITTVNMTVMPSPSVDVMRALSTERFPGASAPLFSCSDPLWNASIDALRFRQICEYTVRRYSTTSDEFGLAIFNNRAAMVDVSVPGAYILRFSAGNATWDSTAFTVLGVSRKLQVTAGTPTDPPDSDPVGYGQSLRTPLSVFVLTGLRGVAGRRVFAYSYAPNGGPVDETYQVIKDITYQDPWDFILLTEYFPDWRRFLTGGYQEQKLGASLVWTFANLF